MKSFLFKPLKNHHSHYEHLFFILTSIIFLLTEATRFKKCNRLADTKVSQSLTGRNSNELSKINGKTEVELILSVNIYDTVYLLRDFFMYLSVIIYEIICLFISFIYLFIIVTMHVCNCQTQRSSNKVPFQIQFQMQQIPWMNGKIMLQVGQN